MSVDADTRFALEPLTLGFTNAGVERDYRVREGQVLTRILKPSIVILLPLVAVLGILDYQNIAGIEWVPWRVCLILVLSLLVLLSVVAFAPAAQSIQLTLFLCLVGPGLALLQPVQDQEALWHLFPGFFVIVMLSQFIGLRFAWGVMASTLLIMAMVAVIIHDNMGIEPLLKTAAFLVPGCVITSVAGYIHERQRRRLHAQLILMEAERTRHEKMALYDSLTQLPNRNLLRERMQQSVARAKRQHGQFAVLFVDLDDFKSVNDSYGHGIGDQVLKQIAANLQQQVRGEDTVARLGGDEFVVLSEHVDDDRGARIAAERIQAAVSTPIVIRMSHRADTIHIHVTCSIGISLCPRDGETLDKLISRADDAMYRAKRGGKSTARFFRNLEAGSTPAGDDP